MKKAVRGVKIGIVAMAAAVFGQWAVRQEEPLSFGAVFALGSLCLFTLMLIAVIDRFCQGLTKEMLSPLKAFDSSRERLGAWGRLLAFGAAVSLLQFAAVYLLSGTKLGFLHSFRELYYRSDVAHYMGIARDWYVCEGDERLRLVFLPLYPLTIRLFTWGGDYFRGAFLSAQFFSLACLPAAYELFRLDMDRRKALTCARLLFLLPGAAFLRVPMSEGLFLFLTVLAVYAARRQRFSLAGLFTALSAFTRSLGILLLGLLFLEMLFVFLDAYGKDRRGALRLIPGFIGSLLIGCSGTLAYLAVNRTVTGDPFTFLMYQRENWNQQLGFFFSTAAYQAEYARMYVQEGDLASVLSLSIPNLLCSFGTLGLLYADRDRMRISYLVWALAYFAASIGATWLLSGPRYLAMLFPLAMVLVRLCKRPAAEMIVTGTLLTYQTAYLLMLALDMSVY